jgi:deoxycytidine triphosphate deaminase
MPILSKKEIERRIGLGELIGKPRCDPKGKPLVETASYDLSVGTILWKDRDSGEVKQLDFDEAKGESAQFFFTLQPGQMVLVVSREDLIMPLDVCGTVYSRNRLQKENILALNAGHVDPGYGGPIIIRLINLSSLPWNLKLGQAVFTAVFHNVEPVGEKGDSRTRAETLEAARRTIADAYANPFHDSYKEQIDRQLGQYYLEKEADLREKFSNEFFRRNQVYQFAFTILVALFAIVVGVPKMPWKDLWEYLKTNRLNVVLIILGITFVEVLIVLFVFHSWRWVRRHRKKWKRFWKHINKDS